MTAPASPPGDPSRPVDASEATTLQANPCKLCAPLGAALAFKGIAATVPLLHGGQGCATYIRRYLISHFREPVDVASSSFSEESAVFGGRRNLHQALDNVARQYRPALIGVATTCLAETTGEDVPMMLAEHRAAVPAADAPAPQVVSVSTASYRGTHSDGFHASVRALVESLAEPPERHRPAALRIACFPGMVSPADLRHLREVVEAWGAAVTMVPDYSETLDGGSWAEYQRLPPGGTSVDDLRALGAAGAALECGRVLAGQARTAGTHLSRSFGVPLFRLGWPVGLRETDALCAALQAITGRPTPRRLCADRGRLVDSYVDGHKVLAGKRAFVYGDEDLVVGVAAFLAETGVWPVVCASGGRSGRLSSALEAAAPELAGTVHVVEGADFTTIETLARKMSPDLLIGSSKGYRLARALRVPLVRCGFPVHDRLGAARLQLLGYSGTQQLYDRIVNALLERKQEESDVGYGYL